MWNYVIIEIERKGAIQVTDWTRQTNSTARGAAFQAGTIPCWNILYKAPIDVSSPQLKFISDVEREDVAEQRSLSGCQVWLEQNKVEGSKYAIMKMFIV